MPVRRMDTMARRGFRAECSLERDRGTADITEGDITDAAGMGADTTEDGTDGAGTMARDGAEDMARDRRLTRAADMDTAADIVAGTAVATVADSTAAATVADSTAVEVGAVNISFPPSR